MTNEEIEKTIKEARDSGAKRYYLRNEKLSELPESICTLTEVEEISLIGNKLTKLPVKFGELKNLIRLHLSDNSFETIPPEIFLLPKLTHVCIRANKIKLLPENIGELKSIRDIDLDSNRISSIPLTTENIDIIDNLSVLDNPILDPPFQILQQGKEALKLYVEKKGKVLLYTINLPEVILTPFKQYLISFPDFVKASKGKNLKLEVKSVKDGILVEVECESKEDLSKFEEYMAEYSGFVKQNVDDIEIKYEVETFDASKELLLHQTKQEVQFLKMKCDSIEFQNKYLTKDNDFFKSLILEMAKQQPILSFDIKQLQTSSIHNSVTTNITNDIEKLRDSVLELTEIEELVSSNEDLLNEIKEELDSLTNLNEVDVKKSGVFSKIKDLVTNGAKLVKETDDTFESVSSIMEKLSRISELIKPFLE